ncbi:MAG: class I SAM-dependent methyltransferase [bacterium]
MDWFENDEFWTDLYPYLYPPERLKNADNEVEQILSLVNRPIGSALDLCCGPGRHSLALAKHGIRVTAVDRTEYYLEKARKTAQDERLNIEFVHDDMREFVRPEAYDLALNMFTSFGYFESDEDDFQALQNLYLNLCPHGALVMDMVGKEWLAANFQETSANDLDDGSLLIERHEVFDEWRRIRNEWILIRKGQVKSFVFDHRVYSGAELKDRLIAAGFRDVRLYGDLEGTEYGYGSDRLVAVAHK